MGWVAAIGRHGSHRFSDCAVAAQWAWRRRCARTVATTDSTICARSGRRMRGTAPGSSVGPLAVVTGTASWALLWTSCSVRVAGRSGVACVRFGAVSLLVGWSMALAAFAAFLARLAAARQAPSQEVVCGRRPSSGLRQAGLAQILTRCAPILDWSDCDP